jgi:hypothetical protein
MYLMQDVKCVNIGPGAADITGASLVLTSPGYLDTAGFHSVRYVINVGAIAIPLTALNVTECDTTGGTYTVIPLTDFSVLPLTLPDEADNTPISIAIPISGLRKRYQKLVLTAGSGSTFASALAFLGNPDNAPYDSVTRGYTSSAGSVVQEAVVAG